MANLPLTITGTVKRGKGEAGKLFRLPTANLQLSLSPLEPGIYTGKAEVEHNIYNAVICYGVEEGKFEAHLFDFSGDLYDKRLRVQVTERIGDIIPWESTAQMKKVIYDFVKKARATIKKKG
jgi:riboflavin kinase/FMN adenylyltransferase